MSEYTNGHTPPLADAPPAPEAPAAVRPQTLARLVAHVAGESGIAFDAEVANLPFKGTQDLATQIKAFEGQLVKAGLKAIVVAAPAAAAPPPGAPPAAGQVATWIPGNGGPPRCSLHGSAKWIEGTHKETKKDGTPNPQAGKHFEFWACSVQGCKPKGEPK